MAYAEKVKRFSSVVIARYWLITIAGNRDLVSNAEIVARTYSNDQDFTWVKHFLCKTFKSGAPYESWFPDRFEGSLDFEGLNQWASHIRVWERLDDETKPFKKEIVAVANPEGSPRNYYLQVNPEYSFLEHEMLDWIEAHFRAVKKDDEVKENLTIYVLEGNARREALLAQLGYVKTKLYGWLRVRNVDQPIPTSICPEGYYIRTVSKADYDQLAAVERLVFGHEWFTAEVYESITQRSFYVQDLDLVAVAQDGTFAAYCTFRLDPLSKIANLEPIVTHPDHRRRGLGKALIFEGLKRSMKYNPTLFYIGGAADTPAANRLYDSTGYTEKMAYYAWSKEV